jgi:outer membrane protein
MQFLPDLRLSASTANAVGRTFSQSDGALLNQSTQSLNLGVSSSVTLFDGFRNVANLKAAQLNQDASLSELDRAKQTAVFTVASQFLALVQGEEQLKVQREALASQQAQEEQINSFVKVGARPVADLYQQQASVASTRAALVGAQRAWDEAKLDLVQTLQLDPKADYDFATPAIAKDANATSYDVSTLIETALAKRPELSAGKARQGAAEQAVRAANGSRLPTVSLGGNYNTGASSASDLGFSNQLDQRRGGSLSLSVSVPLWDRNSAKTAAQEARIQADNAKVDLNTQRQQVAIQVRKALLGYQSAQEQLNAAEAQLKASELALTTTQERYKVGVANLVEVTQARATQVSAASAVVNARYNLMLQKVLISYYTGEFTTQSVIG